MRRKIFVALLVSWAIASVARAQAPGEIIGSFYTKKVTGVSSGADRSSIVSFAEDIGSSSLAWKCDDALNVRFVWLRYMKGNTRTDSITIAYRFPPQAAVAGQWEIEREHQSAYLPLRDVEAFTRQALTAQSVLLRVTDVDGDSVTTTIKLDGLAEALKTLSCAKGY